MSWPAGFREDLRAAKTVQVRWALEVVPLTIAGGLLRDSWLASTDPRLTSQGILIASSIQIGAVGVAIQTWQHQAGAFSLTIQLVDQEDAGRARRALRRGALCRLLFAVSGGSSLSDYQPLRVGRIQQVTSPDLRQLRVEVWDLLSALRTRPVPALDGDGLPQTRLFNRLGGENYALSASEAAGSTTYDLNGDPTGIFGFPSGGSGLFAVVDDDGNTFYKTFTGVTVSTLTGCSAAGALGTTAAAAASGNAVRACAYLTGHPLQIAAKLLTSTGTASANGTYDVYPASWGFAIDSTWLDKADFVRSINAYAVSSGSYSWDVVVEEPVEDGLLWLSALLSEAGFWLTTKQGSIVPRAAQSPRTPSLTETIEIVDADIAGQPSVEWYDPDCPDAFNKVGVASASSSEYSNLSCSSLPCRQELLYDLSAVVRDNENAIRDEVLPRLKFWGHYPAEIISLTVVSLGWGLCPGDLVPLTTASVRGRLISTYQGYDKHLCMVVEVQEMVQEGCVKLKLAALPLHERDDLA